MRLPDWKDLPLLLGTVGDVVSGRAARAAAAEAASAALLQVHVVLNPAHYFRTPLLWCRTRCDRLRAGFSGRQQCDERRFKCNDLWSANPAGRSRGSSGCGGGGRQHGIARPAPQEAACSGRCCSCSPAWC